MEYYAYLAIANDLLSRSSDFNSGTLSSHKLPGESQRVYCKLAVRLSSDHCHVIEYAIRLTWRGGDDDIGLKVLYKPHTDAQDADPAPSVDYDSRILLEKPVLPMLTASL